MIIHGYDTNLIEKEWNSLKMPLEYRKHPFKLQDLFTHDYSIYMSIREEGKTTAFLILALILYKLYGTVCEYIRNDESMIRQSKVGEILDVIIQFGYIEQLFNGKYNNVLYDRNKRVFNLVLLDEEANIINKDEVGCIRAKSNEKWKSYKSSYNSHKSNFLLVDECLDTERANYGTTAELFNNVSTFGRNREECFVVMLSNTVNKYATLFEDFCINKEVEFMQFGDKLDVVTDLGTSIYLELMEVSEKKKKRLKDKKIRFVGFNNPKFSHFTGLEAWQGYNYPHFIGKPKSQEIVGFIYHRSRYLAIYLIEEEEENTLPALLFTKFDKPRRDDIVYTVNPVKYNERLFQDLTPSLVKLYENKRYYFMTNDIGMLFDDFLNESGFKKIRDN